MKKKVMLLMLIIPVIMMFTIFSVSKVVSVIVEIPTSGIEITTQNNDGMISLDMATYKNDLVMKAAVMPIAAKNRNYTFTISGVGNEPPADISIDAQTGILSVFGVGRAKVTATSNENAYSASVIINIISSKVLDFTPSISDVSDNDVPLTAVSAADYAYEANVFGGDYNFAATVNPSNLSDSTLTWSSSDNNVVEINSVTGRAKAKLSGSATVSAVNANGINGAIERKIKVNVSAATTPSGVLINGVVNGTVRLPKNLTAVELLLETSLPCLDTSTITVNGNYTSIEYLPLNDENTQFKATVLLPANHDDEVPLAFSCDGTHFNTVTLAFTDYAFYVYTGYHTSTDAIMYQKNGTEVSYFAVGEPDIQGLTYTYTSSNENVLAVSEVSDAVAKLSARSEGTSTLTVTAEKEGEIIFTVVKNVTVVFPVNGVEFSANAFTYGIADMLALGNTKLSGGQYSADYPTLNVKYNTSGSWQEYSLERDLIDFEISDESVALVRQSAEAFKLNIISSGKITVSAKWIYSDYFKDDSSATINVQTVADGVNVSGYDALKRATDDNKKVVLQSDIMLGTAGASTETLRSLAYTLPTNYDWQFYANKGLAHPNLYYLIEFKNDVFGNGYEINGDNFTRAVDSTGTPKLFRGPLDFVSIATAAVKAQDNIVFLARTDGVTIDNVVLKGCKDESLYTGSNFDLANLNYTGTTLEIMADVTIKNSRVSNGRTVVRIFGGSTTEGNPIVTSASDVDVSAERVTALIESSILTNAREFILKIGSNRAILASGTDDTSFAAARLSDALGNAYDPFAASNASDAYFNEHYLITDVTLKNSVLFNSGLFSIGLETHFSGIMLSGFVSSSPTNWNRLAATSFASALHLEGDVKLLDWKKLSQIDSSTLIETQSGAQEFLTLDIPAMLRAVYSGSHAEYKTIVSEISGTSYVHGGIAAYGGGYNYSYVDTSLMTSENFASYRINLSVLSEGLSEDITNPLYLQGTMLPLAAGPADFRFYMYNSDSATNYNHQRSTISDGTAFRIPRAE